MQSAYAQGLKLSSQGRHLEAISCFEQALFAKPNDPATLFALGNTAHALGMLKPAAEFFRRVLKEEPGRIEALVHLANLLREEGQFEAARALLEPVLARHPANADLLLTLGSAWREMGDNTKAEHCYRQALEARPSFAPALSNLADLLADDRDFEQARTLYDRALKASGGNPQIRLNRAILHFLAGNLKEAWRDYEARSGVPNKVPGTDLKLPEWRGEGLKPGARLLVRAEQGVGDQLMFASVLPDLLARAGNVILECEKRLVSLAARSFPHAIVRPQMLATVNGVVQADYRWLQNAGGASRVCLLGSLPRWLRKDIGSFPKNHVYLVPDACERAHWKKIFAEHAKPVIGLCWRSGKTGGHRSVQYAPLPAWGEFLRDVPGTLVCCQYDGGTDEIAQLESLSGRKIFVPPALDQKNELDRTAAMLSALDILVSAPTAVSWLAAGAGVPALKLLYDRSWTSFGETYEPLAPACRCVTPKKRADWADVFAQARAVIAQR